MSDSVKNRQATSFAVKGGAGFEEMLELMKKSLILPLVLSGMRDWSFDNKQNLFFLLVSHGTQRIPSY